MLEDDAGLTDDFARVAREVFARINPGDVVLLCHWGVVRPSRFHAVPIATGALVYVHRRSPLGTVGYMISRDAARLLLSRRRDQASSTADDWEHAGTTVVLRTVVPALVEHDLSVDSHISAARFESTYTPPALSTKVAFKLRRIFDATGPMGRFVADVALEAANALRYSRARVT